MAIPNPNPNIKDGVIVDNKTWSSNKIKEGLTLADVNVNSDGSLNKKVVSLLRDFEVEEAGTTFNFTDINSKHVLILIDFTFTETTSMTTNIFIKTDEVPGSWFTSGAFATRSHTANARNIALFGVSVEKGYVDSFGFDASINGYANLTKSMTDAFITNIIATNIKDVQVTTNTALPIGTKIKVYGY